MEAGECAAGDGALGAAFVELADTLVADYDVVDLLYRLAEICVDVPGVDAAGLLLHDPQGALFSAAATSEKAWSVELFQEDAGEGPGPDCFRTGAPVAAADVAEAHARWPRFVPELQRSGFAAVHALPLRLRTETIGALILLGTEPGALSARTLRLTQALADVATIGILQEREIRRGHITADHLQSALTSRILIEQAKGILANHAHIGLEQAFTRLRNHARTHQQRMTELARSVISGDLDLDTLAVAAGSR